MLLGYVTARLNRVEAALVGAAAEDEAGRAAAAAQGQRALLTQQMYEVAARSSGDALPDAFVAARLGLTAFEVEALWLASAPALDPGFHGWVAKANGHARRDAVDAALCLRLLCTERFEVLRHQPALQPNSILFESGLLRGSAKFDGEQSWLRAALTPADHWVAALSGRRALGRTLAACAQRLEVPPSFADLPGVAALDDVRALIARTLDEAERPDHHGPAGLNLCRGAAAVLTGAPGSGRATAARALAASLGRAVIEVDGAALDALGGAHASEALTEAARQAHLYGELLLIRDADALLSTDASAPALSLRRALERLPIAALLCAEDASPDSPLARVTLLQHPVKPHHSVDTRRKIWEAVLPPDTADAPLKRVNRLLMTPLQIRKTAQLAALLERDRDADPGALLETIARANLKSARSELAVAQEARRKLAELILPQDTIQELNKIITAYANRSRVLVDWRLGERISSGTGIVCLLNGEPGTGKTMAAEVIAHELGLQLLRINVATIVSKYIGETEKNLTRIFEQANPDMDLLLFDEADSLFAKRTEVKQATDRYANMEINLLLQLVEQYRGIAVLTTNIKQGLDPAFSRRISYKIEFPVPDYTERMRIWRSLLPDFVPTAEPIDYDMLADAIALAGGGIKNAILRAAYHAAAQDRLLETADLYESARAEAAAEGRLIRDS